jgi:putative glutamine amidotransferase
MKNIPNSATRPRVLVPCGAKEIKGHLYQLMGRKYLDPLLHIAQVAPILVPTCQSADDLDAYLDIADGIYYSGQSTNINPALYGEEWKTRDGEPDIDRDHYNIAMVKAGLARGLPFFGICRGLQELNVARGGTLHQIIQEEPGMLDHREKDGNAPYAEQYGPNHQVSLIPQEWLAQHLPAKFMVNSLHRQGVKKLGRDLAPLAHADDGLIEAVYCTDMPQFTLAVQWHPEWMAHDNPNYAKLFQLFGEACQAFATQNRNQA